MQAGHFLVEVLRQGINAQFVIVFPQLELSQGLIGEGVAHDKAGVTGGIAQVYKASARQQYDAVSVGKFKLVDLRLDVDLLNAGGLFQFLHLNLVVEVANVAYNGGVLHFLHVLHGNYVAVTGGGDINVGLRQGFFNGGYFIAFHGGLQGTNGVDFGYEYPGAETSHALRAALAHIAIAANQHGFSGHHYIGAPLDAVGKTLATAV